METTYQKRRTRLSGAGRRLVMVPVLLLVLAAALPCAGQTDTTWINGVTGEVVAEHLTPQQAREQAIANACAEGLRRRGVQVQAVQFYVQSEAVSSASAQRQANEAFVNVIRTGSQGVVTGRRNERWESENLEKRPDRPPLLRYRVSVDLQVTAPAGEPDPDFQIRVRLNQPAFRDGDRVILEVIPTKECFLSVFNIAGDSVRLLYPYDAATSAPVRAEQVLRFPPQGARWTAVVPQSWPSCEELLLVVATRTKREYHGGKVVPSGPGYVSTRQSGLMELMAWIGSIPRGELAEAVERLSIVR